MTGDDRFGGWGETMLGNFYSFGKFLPKYGVSSLISNIPFKGLSEYFIIFSRYSIRVSSLSISSLRFLDISKKDSSLSIPTNLRFNKLAAIPVVELPQNGSKIVTRICSRLTAFTFYGRDKSRPYIQIWFKKKS